MKSETFALIITARTPGLAWSRMMQMRCGTAAFTKCSRNSTITPVVAFRLAPEDAVHNQAPWESKIFHGAHRSAGPLVSGVSRRGLGPRARNAGICSDEDPLRGTHRQRRAGARGSLSQLRRL